MDNKNKTFVFYTEWKDYLELLSPEEIKNLIFIIIDFVENQNEPKKPNLTDRLELVWIGIKSRISTDKTRYDKRCETSKENGKKGGRPRKNKNLSKNLNNLKNHDNEYEDDNDYVNDNEYEDDDEVKESSSADNFFQIVEENFGFTVPPMMVEKLNDWRKIFSDDIITYAIEICCKNNARTVSYLEAILNDWKNKGFKKLVDCKNEKRDNSNKTQKPFKEEKIPEWFDKKIERKEATPEEIKEMEELLGKYK